ncbi:glucose-1-phosphate adenylyltransferase [Marinobacter sp. NFXS9]|uniref:glucose-1-phosphate adenylyltransferase n=1 Tax=Marinobacter sp. NFXS9 TaxID=2818433 RepID=UPI0032DFD4A0
MNHQPLSTARYVSRLTRQTLALILAGGRGSRLRDLTDWRAKPAVPFGGKFRIIDFALSNCVNSGVRQIGVVTQYKSHSLIRHIQRGWGFLRGELGEFVELLPAQQRIEAAWYAGTADAVLQNLDIIRSHRPAFILILAGDHIYKMDYGTMLAFHVENNADVTVGCVEVPLAEASSFGVLAVDSNSRVQSFREKPADPSPIPGTPDKALVSMGIYVFRTEALCDRVLADHRLEGSHHDFGRDIIPAMVENAKVAAFPFRDPFRKRSAYWRDVGTVDSLWQANLELTESSPELDLYDVSWPIWTFQEQLPAARFVTSDGYSGVAEDAIVAGGCLVKGGRVSRSVLFSRASVAPGSEIEQTVVFPDVSVGRHCRIRRAMIDRGCRIPDGMHIGIDPATDAQHFHISPGGVVVVTPERLGQDYPRGL